MNASDTNPAKIPLLFPDPVIEFYLEKVDRAAIRVRLQMTVDERLAALEREAEARAPTNTARVREESPRPKAPPLDMGVDPAWFVEAKAVPLLFPDPVVEEYLEDVDRGLIREQLKLGPEDRLRCLENMADFYEESRRNRR